jgi:hypothetical protein
MVRRGGCLGVFHLRGILMALMVVRLLMPPGICVCKLNSPAARLLVRLLQLDREVPPPPEEVFDADDHAPGCPCSPLAAGMGVKPTAELPPPPALSFDTLPSLEATQYLPAALIEDTVCLSAGPPEDALYLTLCALLI